MVYFPVAMVVPLPLHEMTRITANDPSPPGKMVLIESDTVRKGLKPGAGRREKRAGAKNIAFEVKSKRISSGSSRRCFRYVIR